ncbi:hypothetical protein [Aeromicrobium sp. Leaf350]|uniref:hypothetical protein n=1 Tax=Aeromicrobium sp. Leaf350 TaxID=2876565 RepID=UPI001E393E1C|nr:hypothetical protein [Aeromicrobium sp. Leaf350]
MRKTSARAVTALAVALLLTACGGSTDDDPSPPSTTATDGGRSTTGQVSACTIVDRSVADPLNPNGEDLVPTLLIGDLTYDGCTVGDVYSVSFGIKVVDSDETLEDRVEILGGNSGTEPVDDLGDEAFRSEQSFGGETLTISIGVRVGDHEVLLRNDSPGNTDPANRVSEDAMIEFLEAYLPAIPDDFESQALTTEVDSACLPADDATIEDGVDTIQLARGGRSGTSVRCAYLGDHLATVQLSRSSNDDPTGTVELSRSSGAETVTVEGAVDAVISASSRSVTLTIQPSADEIVYMTVSTSSGSLDPTAMTSIAAAFLAQSSGS